jgi:hypothetical protein
LGGMQACVSQLRSLTRLEVECVSAPLDRLQLQDLFASLPALQDVCLVFSPMGDPDDSDSDSNAEGPSMGDPPVFLAHFHVPDGFPLSLTMCVSSVRLSDLAGHLHHLVTHERIANVAHLLQCVWCLHGKMVNARAPRCTPHQPGLQHVEYYVFG